MSKSDSLEKVIDDLGLFDCMYYKDNHTSWITYAYEFRFDTEGKKLEMTEDTITVSWHLPEKEAFEGNYYLVVRTFFDEYLDIIITTNQRAFIDLRQYNFNWEKDGVILDLYKEGCIQAESRALVKK